MERRAQSVVQGDFEMDFYKHAKGNGRLIKLDEVGESAEGEIQVIFRKDGALALIKTNTQIV